MAAGFHERVAGGGDYDVEVLPAIGGEPFAPANGSAFPAVSVADGTTHVDGLRLVVRFRRLRIAGMVVDGAGEPVGDVAVQLAGSALWPARSARSDATGRLRVDGLVPGQYLVWATAGELAHGFSS